MGPVRAITCLSLVLLSLSTSPEFSSHGNGRKWRLALEIQSHTVRAIGLQELPVHQRSDAVSSLVYEANARMRDPVYGCVGAISFLQNQVSQLQMQLAVAEAEILCIQMQQNEQAAAGLPTTQISMDDSDGRSLLLSTGNSTGSNFMSNQFPAQYGLQGFGNSSSASSVVMIQDPLKRESLWT